jgi:hypothetical protein
VALIPTQTAQPIQAQSVEDSISQLRVAGAVAPEPLTRGAEFKFGYQYIINSAAAIKEALKRSPVGVTIGNDELTSFISTGVTIVAALWVMIRRVKQGDIGVFGGRKR